ncbi:MAG TPA: HupE/UreJ family protein [Gemmatimonadaceae bacterium]|nr:HupE/UreJ family protein [Gemmatimonadaceae bacterium]
MRTCVSQLVFLFLMSPAVAAAGPPQGLVPPALGTATISASAAAHAPGQAYVFLRLHPDSIVVRLEFFGAHLDRALALGWEPDAPISLPRVREQLEQIRGYVESHFAFAIGDQPLAPAYRGVDTRMAEPGEFVLLEYVLRTPRPDRLTVSFTPFFEIDDKHRNLLVIEHDWRTATFNNEGNVSLIFEPRSPTQELDLTSASIWRGFAALVRLGTWHIWIGYDHILFLIALALPSVLYRRDGRWQPAPKFRSALWKIVKIVTCFTIAHTITLSLAALDVVHVPSRLVEAVIAASIAAAALHNLWPVARINEPAIAFVFGLFHGFGFASVLGDIGLGRDHLVLSLLGFNLGVEIGQVAIIMALFPVLFLIRHLRVYGWMMRLGSATLVAIGLLLAAERALDFNVPIAEIARGALSRITGHPPEA